MKKQTLHRRSLKLRTVFGAALACGVLSLSGSAHTTHPVLATPATTDAEPDTSGRFFPDRVYQSRRNADDVCARLDGTAPDPEIAARVAPVLATLRQSASAANLLEAAIQKEVVYCYASWNEMGVMHGTYYEWPRILAVRDDLELRDEIKLGPHELRHFWQMVYAGFDLRDVRATPEAYIMTAKSMEADAEAFANLVMLELEQAGHPSFTPDFTEKTPAYTAIHNAFRATYERGIAKGWSDKKAKNHAVRAAFDTWFSTMTGKGFYEPHYLGTMENRLYRFRDTDMADFAVEGLSSRQIVSIGRLPNGQNYITATGGIKIQDAPYAPLLSPENQEWLDRINSRIAAKRIAQTISP